MSESIKEESVAMTQLRKDISVALTEATNDDRKKVKSLVGPEVLPAFCAISPAVAAILFTDYNTSNRNINVSRSRNYASDMLRGEWHKNHQGIAFYTNGKLSDGQHRLAAIALSGTTQMMLIVNGMDESSIDTVDRSTRRTAGESLQMKGMMDGKLLAKAAKEAMQYTARVNGESDRFTDIQIEKYAINHREELQHALHIGEDSVVNVTDPCLPRGDAQMIAVILVIGGWHNYLIEGFLSSLQRGVATYPEAPTTFLSKVLMRSKLSDRRKDVIPKFDQKALCMKAIELWAHGMSVSKIKWSMAEGVPTNVMPTDIKPAD